MLRRITNLLTVLLLALPLAARAEWAPVEIRHQFGTAVITSEPKRVVSLSFIGHDYLLALGVKPYALRKWFGNYPYGVWPWAQDALGGAQPIVMQGEINIEQIAAMEPDLIVGQWSGMTARDYALLSKIAPTVAPKAEWGDYGSPWQEMLRTLGIATGRMEQAEDYIQRLEARFAAIRETHPEWQGATAAIVWAGRTGAYTDRDIRGQFLNALGFEVPEAINARGTFDSFYILIPDEDLSPIDVDALIWIDAGNSADRLNRLPLRPTMRAYREGREVYAGQMLAAALSHSSPLSLDYVLDELVPLLKAATDGDPATEVPSSRAAGILPGGS